MTLATKLELIQHENKQIKNALFNEKKKHNRSKHLNLIGEEATGVPQFFSPTRVLIAQAFQESKETAAQEEIRQKALKKIEKERVRIQKLAEQQDAKLQKEIQRQFNKEQKAAEQAKKKAEQAKRKAEREHIQRAKQFAAYEKKLEQIKRKEATTAAAPADSPKTSSKRAPAASGKKARKAPIPGKKVSVRARKSTQMARLRKQPDPAPPVASIDVAATGSSTRSRSGRPVTKPARFED